MAPRHPNEVLARRLWDATADGDADTLLEVYASDMVWHVHGAGLMSGEVKGARRILETFSAAADHVDDLRSELIDVLASDRGALIHYRVTAERSGRDYEGDLLLLMRIEDGQVVRGDVVPFDQKKDAEFWRTQ